MSPQFWQGVLAATGGWMFLSLGSCALLACFLQQGRARRHLETERVADA